MVKTNATLSKYKRSIILDMTDEVRRLASWINDNIVGSPWALIACILFVFTAYLLLVLQGYNKWNLSTGLFANDMESAYELITGTASVVAVVALHKTVKKSREDTNTHNAEIKLIHQKHSEDLKAIQDKLNNMERTK